jgi:iron(III) transport system substrate-binding protein
MPSPRRLAVTAASVGLVLTLGPALAACGAVGGDEQVVRVYSGRHYDLEEAFTRFSDETGISVEFLNGSDPELRERIAAEGEDTQADVFMTVDAANLAVAADEGIFQPLDSPVLDTAVPESLRDPENRWFGLSIRARTIVYSTERLSGDEIPTTYAELADPAWKGRVCLRNSSNTYTQSLVASLIANRGEDEARRIVEGWAANAELLANDVMVLESIADGRCDVGITNHYYLARKLEEDPEFPVGLVWADQEGDGTHVNISGAGVTKYADDPDLAQRLLEWLATDGQASFVGGNHELPVNADVPADDLVTENFGTDFRQDELNAAEIGRLNAEAVRLMDDAGYR